MSAPAFESLVLAAGAGRRFGGGKLLAPWKDGLVLHGALAAAFAAPVRRVTVVTGADHRRVSEAVWAWAEAKSKTDRLVVTDGGDWAEGLAASLRRGVFCLPADTEAVFVFLGDMPRVPCAVLPRLAEAVARGAPAAAPVFDGRRGHPALIGATLFPRLLTLHGEQGARSVLERLGERLALVEAPDDGVLYDVDTPEDLARG